MQTDSACLRKINGGDECKELCEGCFQVYKNQSSHPLPTVQGENPFHGTKPLAGKEAEILNQVASDYLSDKPTGLDVQGEKESDKLMKEFLQAVYDLLNHKYDTSDKNGRVKHYAKTDRLLTAIKKQALQSYPLSTTESQDQLWDEAKIDTEDSLTESNGTSAGACRVIDKLQSKYIIHKR